MILIITLTIDRTLDLVTKHLESPYLRLNVNENPLSPLTYEWDSSGFSAFYKDIDLSDVRSVWYRISALTYYRQAPGSYEMLNRKCRETVVFHLYDWLDAYWLSHPMAVQRSQDKMLQLREAVNLGLSVPHTLVTSDPRKVRKFRETHENIVVKPPAKHMVKKNESYYSVFTNRVRPDEPMDLRYLPSSPAIFQEEVDRLFDIRTIVVGRNAYSIAIHQVGSKKGGVDYRVGADKDLVFEPYVLPLDVKRAAVALVKTLGLEFGALDFILGKDQVHYFLEINPCGAWVFVQNSGNYPIAENIAHLLMSRGG